jgi:ornithine cyclodeaminase/alanine dehydrogenase-like protein (mu-crystallin family)
VARYLTEEDVAARLTPAAAFAAVESSLGRQARGEVESRPRQKIHLADGDFAVMQAVDRGLGLAGIKTYVWVPAGAAFAVVLFSLAEGSVEAVIEADRLGRLRTGAASAVAATRLARPGATTLGVIGCGHQAESHVVALRAALPTIERTVVHCRDVRRLEDFCARLDCEPGASSDAGGQEIVVTATTSVDPVLRGEWLRPGALVCAIGANAPEKRELDRVVLERAAFVCTDSVADARLEAGDLIEPVARGTLDWLEVHELHEVVAGEVAGRGGDDDIVVFKSNGIAAWDLAAGAAALKAG